MTSNSLTVLSEHRLEFLENLLQAQSEHGDGVAVLADTRMIHANAALAQLCGYREAELLALPSVFELIAPEEQQRLRESLRRRLAGERVSDANHTLLIQRDGRRIAIEYFVKPFQLSGQRLAAVIIRDISERRRAEQELRQRADELAVLYETTLALTAGLALSDLLKTIVAGACALLAVSSSAIYLYDVMRSELELAESQGFALALAPRVPLGDDLVGQVAQTRQAVLVNDYAQWAGRVSHGALPFQAAVGVPLLYGDELMGVLLTAEDGTRRRGFNETEARLLSLLALPAAHALHLARQFETVQQQASTDELTGVSSRRHLFEQGEGAFARARQSGLPLSALMLDLDHFKEVNDAHGHAAGDQMLRAVAQEFRKLVRQVDILGRYGGEEFVILLPATDLSGAYRLAERLQAAVADVTLSIGSDAVSMTISVGVAHCDESVHDLNQLLARADRALYTAKRGGRNRVALG